MPVSEERQARGTRPPAGREDIHRELGELGEDVITRILALGPDVDDLRAAADRVGRDADAEDLVEAVREAVARGED